MNYEKAVLCAVLEDPESFIELVPMLEAEDFADRRHRSIWRRLKLLMRDQERADAVRIAEMVEQGKIDADLDYIEELRAYLPSIGEYSTKGAVRWAEHVQERARRRQVRETLNDVLQKTQDPDVSADRIMSEVLQAIVGHQQGRDPGGFRPLSEARNEFATLLDQWETGHAVDKEPTGFAQLDQLTGGGLAKGQLVVLGGRPGTLKTAFGWLIARNVAKRIADEGSSGCVAFASLEMQRNDLLKRAVCAEARVDSRLLETGRLGRDQMKRVRKAEEFLMEVIAPRVKVYDGAATSEYLHYQTLMMMAHEDVRLLVVDFAEMVADQGWSEEERVSGIFRAAKEIAKVRHIPVVVLSQLNRQVEATPSRIPGLHHLRWGGAGEAVADSVWFSYYPWLYQARGEYVQVPSDMGFQAVDDVDTASVRKTKTAINKSKWYLIVAKARYGRVGHVTFNIVPEFTLIADYDPSSEERGIVRLNPSDDF
jgi:replicative DNA helicase